MTEEAEQKRVSAELEQRRNQRILKEIEDRELEEAQAMLQEAEKRSKRKKKPVLDGVRTNFGPILVYLFRPLNGNPYRC